MSDHKLRSTWHPLAIPRGRMILVGRAAAQRAAERASAEAAASQAARVAVWEDEGGAVAGRSPSTRTGRGRHPADGNAR